MMAASFQNRQNPSSLEQLARLGAVMADPFSFLHNDHLPPLGGFSAMLKTLAAHPSFSRAVRSAMPSLPPLSTLEWDDRWVGATENPLLSVVLTLPVDRLLDFTRDLSALALHARLQRVLSIADRNALQQALGDPAWELARHEASLAYPAFAGLDRPLALTADLVGMQRTDFEQLGGALLIALLTLESPASLALAALRFSLAAAALSKKFTVTSRQVTLAVRLAERRGYGP